MLCSSSEKIMFNMLRILFEGLRCTVSWIVSYIYVALNSNKSIIESKTVYIAFNIPGTILYFLQIILFPQSNSRLQV